MSDNADRLLYVISARKELAWDHFKAAFDDLIVKLGVSIDNMSGGLQRLRWRVVRILEALGHCDYAVVSRAARVTAGPSALVRLPVRGLPQAILCGARSPSTVAKIQEILKQIGGGITVSTHSQRTATALLPNRVLVEADSVGELENFAERAMIPFGATPVGWSIIAFAGSLDEYAATLSWTRSPELNWLRMDYDLETLLFQERGAISGGLRLSSYSDPVRTQRVYYVWDADMCAQVDRDWGRYLVLRREGRNILHYDERVRVLAVPSSCPLPRLFARALTLCSGYAAVYSPRSQMPNLKVGASGFQAFVGVPRSIANVAAEKLGQQLLTTNLSTLGGRSAHEGSDYSI